MATNKCGKCGRSLTPVQIGLPCPDCGSVDREIAISDRLIGEDKAGKDEVAKRLASEHFQIEAGLTQIFRIIASPEVEFSDAEPIKLLEVNTATPASGVMPLYFGPAPACGILYPSVIVEVTPDEFEQIKAHELKLPEGWAIGEELFNAVDSSRGQ